MSESLTEQTNTCVFIESPYSGDPDRYARYLCLCGFDAYARGEMFVATHAYMTMHPRARNYFVSDYDPKWDVFTRDQAIARGAVLRKHCDLTVFYVDFGMSRGMLDGLAYCEANKLPYEKRCLDVEKVLALKAELITRDFVEAILDKNADFSEFLQTADANVMPPPADSTSEKQDEANPSTITESATNCAIVRNDAKW